MNVLPTPIAGLAVVETTPSLDERGAFMRCFCQRALSGVIGDRQVLQINYSRTEAIGAVRGLHFQHPPFAEMKLVRCLRGRVWDVAVDLRKGSPTFLQWHAEELSRSNNRMLLIPEGFAHGFQVLERSSELLYLHTAEYTPAAEGGIRFDDSAIGINWPLKVVDLSPRDRGHALLNKSFEGITT